MSQKDLKLIIIEINWQGPFNNDSISNYNRAIEDYGIYQIYGTHNIIGANTLLYIGKAQEQTFAQRISQHQDWIKKEYSDINFYIGRLGGTYQVSNKEWSENIDKAEKLLIYFSSPPYNSQYINDYGQIENTIVLNFGKKNRLPIEVSTFWDQSDYYNDNNWNYYKYKE